MVDNPSALVDRFVDEDADIDDEDMQDDFPEEVKGFGQNGRGI